MSDTIHIHIERETPVRVITVEPTGARGADGLNGAAATIAVGTTTTLSPGSSATVANAGTSSAAVFNFGIPTGATGATGATGTAATVAVGTTTTGSAGSSASVTNSGTTSAAVFNFTIPRGETGETGATGATGAAGPNSVTSATTSDGTASLDISNLTLSQAITSGLQTKMTFAAQPTTVGDGQQIIWQWYNGGSPLTTAVIATEATSSNSDKLLFKTSESGSLATSLDLNNSLATFSGVVSSLGATYQTGSTFTYNGSTAATHRTALGLSTLATTTPAVNVATFLETPTSANLAAAVTGETGSGALVFGTSPSLTSPTIGTSATFNATTYTYGAGAAAAHVTALGLPATGNIVTLTGAQTLTNKTLTTPTIAQINGSTSSAGTLTLTSTTNATKGKIIIGTASAYDETLDRLGIGTTSPSYPVEVVRNTASTGDADIPQILLHNLNTSSTSFALMRVKIGTGYAGGYPDVCLQASGGASGVVTIRGLSNHPMRFTTNDTNRMTIAASGEVGIGTTSPSAKAALDLTSTTRGFLPPRMTTTQRDAITSVPAGLMIYNTSLNKLNVYNGTTWETVTSL